MEELKNTVVYAGYLKDQTVLVKSSSGGAFFALSEYFLDEGNAVVATVYNYEKQLAEFQLILSKDDRDRAMGSKYMQSKPGKIFQDSYQWLIDNPQKKLLFVGMGCQADAFRRFCELKGLRERVWIVDIVCHGVPSPKLWNEYAMALQKKYNGCITYLTFKDKRNGWMAPSAYVKINDREYFIRDYVKVFYNRCALRPSCYKCLFAKIERKTDITIGDFWGIDKVMPDYYNEEGNSLFLIHTNRGKILFEKIKNDLNCRESNTKQCWQPNLESPTKKSEFRDAFWKDYNREGISYIMKKYGTVPLRTKVKNKLLKFMGGGTQKVTSIMLITLKGGQHNELEAA